MLSIPKIRETTKCLSKPTDFNWKSAVYEKEMISHHLHQQTESKTEKISERKVLSNEQKLTSRK